MPTGGNTPFIHPTALVHPLAKVSVAASVGPYCVVDEGVELAAGSCLESRVRVCSGTHIGPGVRVFDGAVLGGDPQDRKYAGESTELWIGAGAVIREYCTVNRGTSATGKTMVGNGALLMAYAHVGHDCRVGERAVLANGVQLGGHVEVGEAAVLGGCTAVHQFCRVGAYAYVGGTLKVDRDVPPASRAFGNPLRWAGLNLHALRRSGFASERIGLLQHAYRHLYRSGLSVDQAIEEWQHSGFPDALLAEFFAADLHGLIRPGRDPEAD